MTLMYKVIVFLVHVFCIFGSIQIIGDINLLLACILLCDRFVSLLFDGVSSVLHISTCVRFWKHFLTLHFIEGCCFFMSLLF